MSDSKARRIRSLCTLAAVATLGIVLSGCAYSYGYSRSDLEGETGYPAAPMPAYGGYAYDPYVAVSPDYFAYGFSFTYGYPYGPYYAPYPYWSYYPYYSFYYPYYPYYPYSYRYPAHSHRYFRGSGSAPPSSGPPPSGSPRSGRRF